MVSLFYISLISDLSTRTLGSDLHISQKMLFPQKMWNV
jgi:hypothetical protein